MFTARAENSQAAPSARPPAAAIRRRRARRLALRTTFTRLAVENPRLASAVLRALQIIAVAERGSFIDLELADRHNDLLFSARLRSGEPGLAFLLLEHQSTADPAMPQRLLEYQSRIWARFRREQRGARLPPVIAVLVSHVPGGWTAPRTFQGLFDPVVMALPGLGELMPRFTMIVDDLAHLTNAALKGERCRRSRSSRYGCCEMGAPRHTC